VRVLVAEPLGREGLELLGREHQVDLRTNLARDEFLAALPDYDALLVRSQVKVDAEAIAAGRRLVVVGRAGVGTDNIDLDVSAIMDDSETLDAAADRLFADVLTVASGRRTAAERLGHREFAIHRRNPTI